jgi:para-nitrobenzyl esterase
MTTVNISQNMNPIVQTKQGVVCGVWENGIAVFRGIPYAEPPAGNLRFRPPVQRRRWDGVRDATRFGEIAAQERDPVEEMLLGGNRPPQGDDCLNLNIWTPQLGQASLPVLVWIHGGSFKTGAGSDAVYEGMTFAREGIVTVTINYRLDVLGYMYLGDRPGSGNFGLLDQLTALEWVQENIAAFGGDPGQVTIAGESAGGHSVGELLATPASRGLFRRGILQSGATSFNRPAEVSAGIAAEILGRLGARPGDNEALTRLSTAELLAAASALRPELLESLARRGLTPDLITLITLLVPMPTYGTDILPEPALVAVAKGAARDIDLLIGDNADECAWMRDALTPPSLVAEAAFASTGRTGANVLDSYRRHRPALSDRDATTPLLSDAMFRIPAIRLAEAAQRHNPRTYMYSFAWGSPASEGKFGAAHAFDVPFIWDTLSEVQSELTAFGMDNPLQTLATTMHGALANFIKTGSPQHPSLPKWPAYDLIRRATMRLDVEARVVDDPNGDERQMWEGVQY